MSSAYTDENSPFSVRGWYSARVPRSSFARVHKVLVPHIIAEEGEKTKRVKRKMGEKMDSKEHKKKVMENQNNHIMSA